jgi:hypothetical protein
MADSFVPPAVADAGRYPTESAAREFLAFMQPTPETPIGRYLGVWRMPDYPVPVHVFTDTHPRYLVGWKWERIRAADEQSYADRMRRTRDGMSDPLLASIAAAHRDFAGCAAHSEGQACCLDYLLGDV